MSSVSAIQVPPQLALPPGKCSSQNVSHYCDVIKSKAIPTDMVEIGGQVKNAAKKQGFFKNIIDKVKDSKILNKAKDSKAFAFVKKHKVACAIGAAAVATGAVIAGVVAHNKKKADND